MVIHRVSLPAPRGGRCACGPAKPVPRPLLDWKCTNACHFMFCAAPCRPPLAGGFASGACPNLLKQLRSRRLQPREGRCACGLAKPVPWPLLGWSVSKVF